jgi:hypothetical protein
MTTIGLGILVVSVLVAESFLLWRTPRAVRIQTVPTSTASARPAAPVDARPPTTAEESAAVRTGAQAPRPADHLPPHELRHGSVRPPRGDQGSAAP